MDFNKFATTKRVSYLSINGPQILVVMQAIEVSLNHKRIQSNLLTISGTKTKRKEVENDES